MNPVDEKLTAILQRARGRARAAPMTTTDRLQYAAEVAEGVLGEIRSAYAEQTSYGQAPNYRLSIDDVLFAQQWSATLSHRAAVAAWSEMPENRAAEAAAAAVTEPERVRLPDEAKRVLDSKPRPTVSRFVSLQDAPEGWPRHILNWSWSDTFCALLEARRLPRREREPGEDEGE